MRLARHVKDPKAVGSQRRVRQGPLAKINKYFPKQHKIGEYLRNVHIILVGPGTTAIVAAIHSLTNVMGLEFLFKR